MPYIIVISKWDSNKDYKSIESKVKSTVGWSTGHSTSISVSTGGLLAPGNSSSVILLEESISSGYIEGVNVSVSTPTSGGETSAELTRTITIGGSIPRYKKCA